MKENHKTMLLTAVVMTAIFAAYTIGHRNALPTATIQPEPQSFTEPPQTIEATPKLKQKKQAEPQYYQPQPQIEQPVEDITPAVDAVPEIPDYKTQITGEKIKADLLGRTIKYNTFNSWRFDSVDEFLFCGIDNTVKMSDVEVRVNAICTVKDIENSKGIGFRFYLQYYLIDNYWQLSTVKLLDYKKGNL